MSSEYNNATKAAYHTYKYNRNARRRSQSRNGSPTTKSALQSFTPHRDNSIRTPCILEASPALSILECLSQSHLHTTNHTTFTVLVQLCTGARHWEKLPQVGRVLRNTFILRPPEQAKT